MSLDLFRLLIDFGFLVLIWAVQLVIYPSFGFYSYNNLINWHRSYTTRVTFVVLPLMLAQLVLVLIQLFNDFNWYTVTSTIIILILWLLTFLVFVPLHQSIDNANNTTKTCQTLVAKNWWRTFLWTILFLLSLNDILFFKK